MDAKLLEAIAPHVDFSAKREDLYGLEQLPSSVLYKEPLLAYVKDLKHGGNFRFYYDLTYLLRKYPIVPKKKELTIVWEMTRYIDDEEVSLRYQTSIKPAYKEFCLADIVLGVGRLAESYVNGRSNREELLRNARWMKASTGGERYLYVTIAI